MLQSKYQKKTVYFFTLLYICTISINTNSIQIVEHSIPKMRNASYNKIVRSNFQWKTKQMFYLYLLYTKNSTLTDPIMIGILNTLIFHPERVLSIIMYVYMSMSSR